MKLNRKQKIVLMSLIDLVLLAIVFSMLLYKPGSYKPISHIEGNQVSPYLTHHLIADFYNGLETGEPFEVLVEQAGLNDVIARAKWPMESGGTLLFTPTVTIEPSGFILMAMANFKGVNFVVTVIIKPIIDENGLLHLKVSNLRVGAMNLALLARPIARRMYKIRAEQLGYDADNTDIRFLIARALLAGEPFDPVLTLNDKKARVCRILFDEGFASIAFSPANSKKTK